jgi:gamma-glutamylaminecyclotransferase
MSNARESGSRLLFVYGTLLAGEKYHHLLGDADCHGSAETEPAYELVDLGEYPALVSGGAVAAHGEIYEISEQTMAELDVLEDVPHLYQRGPIRLADGRTVETYLYIAGGLESQPRISDGDWRAYVARGRR